MRGEHSQSERCECPSHGGLDSRRLNLRASYLLAGCSWEKHDGGGGACARDSVATAYERRPGRHLRTSSSSV
eukprot:5397141-Pleurochrysis_carterae.AAC.1